MPQGEIEGGGSALMPPGGREEVRSAVKSAAWTICLLAEVLKESDVDWRAASELARILEGQAEGLKAQAWRWLLSKHSDLKLQ